ncbi:hypothetical protein BJ170DRAFT_118466 [Xylariales sp. AK1849]|nr:hypothetical protein BJ170DRAFT_118466 [Xylariales sp. AK1849]
MSSLGESINAATRAVHTKLNKLIIYRLPLAIPPQSNEPSSYISGLLHICPIYNTFESSWQTICKSVPLDEENALGTPHRGSVCTRVHSLLTRVHAPELERTAALKEDITIMTGWSPSLLEDQLASAAESPILSAFLQHLHQAVRDRPHVLLAYAWVLYMALFSGGRFIRASLARVAPSFWTATDQDPEILPLRFFTFDAPQDGDEIKLAFKKRLAESSDSLLTADEREDVVAEAKCIFEFMVGVVEELDVVCSMDPRDTQGQIDDESVLAQMSKLLGLRTRDSIAVYKERRALAKRVDNKKGSEERVESCPEGVDHGGEHAEHVRFQ